MIGVLPVQVQAIEAMVAQQVESRVNKVLTLIPVAGHGGVLGRAFVPATNHSQYLEVVILALQANGLVDEAQIIVQPRVQRLNLAIIVDAKERIAQMRAQVGIDVGYIEFAIATPVIRPRAPIAVDNAFKTTNEVKYSAYLPFSIIYTYARP